MIGRGGQVMITATEAAHVPDEGSALRLAVHGGAVGVGA
jgi:hypothetical protein